MRPTLTGLVLAVGLFAVSSPRTVNAQDEAGAGSEKQTAGGESAPSNEETSEEEEDGSSESAEESASSSGEQPSKTEQGAASDSESEQVPEEGPGGREMREDYPGTEESRKKQMESDRIEGLEFEEGRGSGQGYDVQIQQLETEVDDLKEGVFQSKSRVVLLKETVLGGNLSGSRAIIVHSNDLGGQFDLERAMYSLDGNRVFNESKKTGKLKGNKLKVYDGSISSGSHNVSILLEYQGSGYGLFNYMKGYQMKITSSCQFKAKAGKATILRVSATKKGGALREAMKSADVKCEVETTDVSQEEVGGGNGDGASSDMSSSDEE